MEKEKWAPRLIRKVKATVKKWGRPEDMASHLNKKYQTLHGELNANPDPKGNRTHKLGLVDWIRILFKTRDFSSFYMVAALLGFVAIPFEHHAADDLRWLKQQARHARAHSAAGLNLLNLLEQEGRLTPEQSDELIQDFYLAAQESMNIAHALKNGGGDECMPQAA